MAVPLQPIASGELAASLEIINVPEALPATVGLNIALRLVLAPAARVTGKEGPDSEMPVPEADTAEIAMLDDPAFVKRTVCVDSLPTFTSPKLTEAGVTVRFEGFETPAAVKATTTGESGALLLIIIWPETGPLAAAVNVVETVALCPTAKAMGTGIGFIVNAEPVTEIPETVTGWVPLFVIVKIFDAL